MDKQATYDDVNLILKLYELRREERMRKARAWFFGYKASTPAEHQAVCAPGSEAEASFRMLTTYWDMAASFITAGVLNQELFLQSGGELLFVWTKIEPLIPEFRKMTSPRFMSHMEAVAKGAIDTMNRSNPKAYEAFAARVRGM
jgi:hypothetical protein